MRQLFKPFILSLFLFSGCGHPADTARQTQPDSTQINPASVQIISGVPQEGEVLTRTEAEEVSFSDAEITIFKNIPPLDGYGYDIVMKNGGKIHQPQIPAIAGNHGFSSEEAARKVANLVADKLRHSISPPAVSPKELDSLGVLH